MNTLDKILEDCNELQDNILSLLGLTENYEEARSAFSYYITPHEDLMLKNAIMKAYHKGINSTK